MCTAEISGFAADLRHTRDDGATVGSGIAPVEGGLAYHDLSVPPRPFAGKQRRVLFQQPGHAIGNGTDIATVAVLVVHDDPLAVPERGNLFR